MILPGGSQGTDVLIQLRQRPGGAFTERLKIQCHLVIRIFPRPIRRGGRAAFLLSFRFRSGGFRRCRTGGRFLRRCGNRFKGMARRSEQRFPDIQPQPRQQAEISYRRLVIVLGPVHRPVNAAERDQQDAGKIKDQHSARRDDPQPGVRAVCGKESFTKNQIKHEGQDEQKELEKAVQAENQMEDIAGKSTDRVPGPARHRVQVIEYLKGAVYKVFHQKGKGGKPDQRRRDCPVSLRIFKKGGQQIADSPIGKAEQQHEHRAEANISPDGGQPKNGFIIKQHRWKQKQKAPAGERFLRFFSMLKSRSHFFTCCFRCICSIGIYTICRKNF